MAGQINFILLSVGVYVVDYKSIQRQKKYKKSSDNESFSLCDEDVAFYG